MRRLTAEGVRVRAIHRRDRENDVSSAEWVRVRSLEPTEFLLKLVEGFDAVIHLAALAHQYGRAAFDRRTEFFRINVEGTRTVVRASRAVGVRRIVFLSSVAAVCSQSEVWVNEQTPCRPNSDYGRSKLEAEHVLASELSGARTEWCVLRPPLAYGPGNPGNMERLMRLIGLGLPLPLAGIRNLRSFIFLDNLVDAIAKVALDDRELNGTYMVSDGSDFSTPQLISTLASAAGKAVRLFSVPSGLLKAAGLTGDMLNTIRGVKFGIDSYSVERLLGSLPVQSSSFRTFFQWQPPVTWAEALERTCRATSVSA